MSNIAIQGAATGTGVFTLASPATNTDRTLVLPDEAGTVLTSVSDIAAAKLTGALPAISGGALTNLPASGLGVGQTWQVVTGSRALSTLYYNTTGKPMGISIEGTAASPNWATYLYIGGLLVGYSYQSAAYWPNIPIFGIIPPGASYQVTGNSFVAWAELS